MLVLRSSARLRLLLVSLAVLLTLAPLALPGLPSGSVAQAASLEKIDPALQQLMSADRSRLLPIVVEMHHARTPFPARPNAVLAQQALDLIRASGQAVGALPIVNGAAGWANAIGIEAISASPAVAYVHEDMLVQPRKRPQPRAVWPPGQLSAPYPRVVGADRTWLQGTTGKSVAVAVLDSGIVPDADLTQPINRIVASVNFAGDRGGTADPGGHGTHVAGIIAGNGTRSGGEYVGIAPEANVVDVRVLNRNGNGRVSSVVRGIEWVIDHKAQYNIGVINLSLGAPPRTSYRIDPLATAVEIAWKRGIVVVAAAGNGGTDKVETPGVDPYVVTVGATDDLGTLPTGDDELAWFSAWGAPYQSVPRPDLVAPGRRIVSVRAPGSTLDTLYPDRLVLAKNGSTYFRLTGTSMSTPVVAGTVALMLQRQPNLTPDEVKAILLGTTQVYGQSSSVTPPDPSADGYGLVDAYAATNSGPLGRANQGLRPSSGLARVLYPILYGQPLVWEDPNHPVVGWDDLAWDDLAWDDLAWDDLAWDDLAWDDLAWDDLAWDDLAWDRTGWDAENVAWQTLTLD